MAPRTKSQRHMQRLARNSLSIGVIVDAVEELVRNGNADPSIRDIALSLKCSTMAVYNYFPTKEALLLEVLDRVLGSIPLVSDSSNWREGLKEFARNHRETLSSNAWAIPLLFRNPSTGPNSMNIGEYAFQLMSLGGVKQEKIVAAFSALIAMNYGWASFTTSKPADFAQAFSQHAQNYPRTEELAHLLVQYGSPRDYEVALELLIDSL